MNKNVKVLYFSPTDGTKKIVTTIANSIDPNFQEIDLTLPQNRVNALHFTNNDLVIIGMPTYAGRLPKLLLTYLDKLTAHDTLGVFITTYGNRDYEDALLEQHDLFTAKGFIALGAATFITEHSSVRELAKGRPNVDDLKTASDFGKEILARLNAITLLADLTLLSLPGNKPYVVKNLAMPVMVPETNGNCVACGICAKHCPTAAINLSDCKTIDSAKCIKCNSCIKRCPVQAKSITHEAYKNMQNMLLTNFASNSKQPETFLA